MLPLILLFIHAYQCTFARGDRLIALFNQRPSEAFFQPPSASNSPVILTFSDSVHVVIWSPETSRNRQRHIAEINQHENCLWVEEDGRVSITAQTSNVTSVLIQDPVPSWGLARIGQRNLPLKSAYAYPATQGEDVDIYIVDTGVDIHHADFGGRAQWGITTVQGAASQDVHGHGTMVAGIAAGTRFGVAKKARIIAVKALDDNGDGHISDIISGMHFIQRRMQAPAQRKPKTVINLSFGAEKSSTLDYIVDSLSDRGALVVAAAGNGVPGQNDNMDACSYSPARSRTAITVGASDQYDHRAIFSNHGRCLNLFAPGADVRTTTIGRPEAQTLISGTSFSAPHVSGVIALILAENTNRTYSASLMRQTLVNMSTRNVLTNVLPDTPNLLLFTGYDTLSYMDGPTKATNSASLLLSHLSGWLVAFCLTVIQAWAYV